MGIVAAVGTAVDAVVDAVALPWLHWDAPLGRTQKVEKKIGAEIWGRRCKWRASKREIRKRG